MSKRTSKPNAKLVKLIQDNCRLAVKGYILAQQASATPLVQKPVSMVCAESDQNVIEARGFDWNEARVRYDAECEARRLTKTPVKPYVEIEARGFDFAVARQRYDEECAARHAAKPVVAFVPIETRSPPAGSIFA